MRDDSGAESPPSEREPTDSARAQSGPPLIFVSDASAEAERLTKALRERGYAVVDVPLSMLVNRVAVQRPALILCDVDADSALETTHRLRDVPGGSGVDLIFLGETGRTLSEMADAVIHESSGIFIRPVDTYALLRKVEGLIGPPIQPLVSSSRPPSGRSEAGANSNPPTSHRPLITPSVPPPSSPERLLEARRSFPPRGSNPPRSDRASQRLSGLPFPSEVSFSEPTYSVPSSRPPASSQHPDSALPSLPPPVPLGVSLDSDPLEREEPVVSHALMSPDLENLLARAEQRVAQAAPSGAADSSAPPARLTPEEEVDAVLPPDVLAALDDPLEEDSDLDDESSVGSRAQYGTRSGSEGGSKEAHTSATGAVEARRDGSPRGVEPGARVLDRDSEFPQGTGIDEDVRREGERVALFADSRLTGTTGLAQGPVSSTGAGAGAGELTSARGITTTGFVPPPPVSPRHQPAVDDAARRATTPPPPRLRDSSPPETPRPGRFGDEHRFASNPGEIDLSPPRVPAWDAEPALQPSFQQAHDSARAPAPAAEQRWAPLGSNEQAPTVPPPAQVETEAEPRRAPSTMPPASLVAPPATTRMQSLLDRALDEPTQAKPRPAPAIGAREQQAAPAETSSAERDSRAPATDRGRRAAAERAAAPSLEIPEVLREGEALAVLARAVRSRFSGGIAFEHDAGIRRVILRDGDFITAASSIHAETLLAFLVKRGSLAQDVATQLGRRLPPFGRHAGAALIAHGHLRQDDLWPVLRAHAEWVLGLLAAMPQGSAELEENIPGRLEAEPAVFGGATGAEVLLEVVRRAVPPAEAVRRLGGGLARLAPGPQPELIGECALEEAEVQWVARAQSNTVRQVLEVTGDSFAPVLYALLCLGVLESLGPARTSEAAPRSLADDHLDDDALRERIGARRRLVDEADYFALLGLAREATAYDIRRAYIELRREFEPSRVLTARTADLADEVSLIIEVLDEAYDVLKDDVRRERYRRALLASPY